MNAPSPRVLAEELPSERRTHILDAAERSFTRGGFHGTTMQDVAAEAGMSPGNLYRYFASKDALVAGPLRARPRRPVQGIRGDAREPAATSWRLSAPSATATSTTKCATRRSSAWRSGRRRRAIPRSPRCRRSSTAPSRISSSAPSRPPRSTVASRPDDQFARRRLNHRQARRRPLRAPRRRRRFRSGARDRARSSRSSARS